MIEQVLHTIEKYKLLESGDKVLVAVSGGPDSVCLLWILNEISSRYSLKLRIAHLNHGLRKEATKDAAFVKNMAQELGIPCTTRKKDVKRYAKTHKLSLEEGAREVRYKFLEAVAAKFGMAKIATGHTASDEVETLVLRLARGTGLKGLSLIPPKRDKIIRPLIEIERREILEFLKSQNIAYRIDISNFDLSFPRNFVRHKIVPLLNKLAPDFSRKVLRMREALSYDDATLEQMTDNVFQNSVKLKGTSNNINLQEFSQYAPSIKRRLVRKIVASLSQRLPSFEQIEAALDYIDKGSTGSAIEISGVLVEKGYTDLKFRLPTVKTKSVPLEKTVFPVPGKVEVGGIKIKSRIIRKSGFDPPAKSCLAADRELVRRAGKSLPEADPPRVENPYKGKDTRVYFDLAKLKLPLFIRSRKDGDKFYGPGYTKKLKAVFIDDKIPRSERLHIPLLLDQDGILWIIGHRRSGRAFVEKDANKILEIITTGGTPPRKDTDEDTE